VTSKKQKNHSLGNPKYIQELRCLFFIFEEQMLVSGPIGCVRSTYTIAILIQRYYKLSSP